jgi:hypothetical protein
MHVGRHTEFAVVGRLRESVIKTYPISHAAPHSAALRNKNLRLGYLHCCLCRATPVGMRLTSPAALLCLILLGCTPTSNTDLRAVELTRVGGQAAAASRPVRIEIDSLDTDDRIALEGLVMTADVPNQPRMFSASGVGNSSGYQLTVQFTDHRQVIVFHDRDDHPPSLDRLAVWIEAHR